MRVLSASHCIGGHHRRQGHPSGQHHGPSWGFAGNLGISCIRARCRKRKYDGSTDYTVLCAELAAAEAAGSIYKNSTSATSVALRPNMIRKTR